MTDTPAIGPVAWLYSNADDLTPHVSLERWREPEASGWTETPLYTRPTATDEAGGIA